MDRKSNLGCFFSIGSGVISWYSRKHKSVALSSTKIEHIAATMETCEAI